MQKKGCTFVMKKKDQKKIRRFVYDALNKIIKKFSYIYKRPEKECKCLDIIKKLNGVEKSNFLKVADQTCNNLEINY